MLERHWKGVTFKDRADDYVHHLESETFQKLKDIPGFKSASILTRNMNDGIEFLIITRWENIQAIKKFSGEDYELAVVPDVVKEMMVRYDERAVHYTVH